MRLKIVTPEKIILDVETKGVFVKAIDGELGVLPGHIPLMTALDIGVAHYITEENLTEFISIIGGTFKIENDEVTILTEAAELGEDIDQTRAEQAVDRARAKLKGMLEQSVDKHSPEMEAARLSVLKAIARIKAANKTHKR
ncbi:MAG: ATP synthase F1 subunit epsilon [Cyanobacteriota bacterium]